MSLFDSITSVKVQEDTPQTPIFEALRLSDKETRTSTSLTSFFLRTSLCLLLLALTTT